MRPREDRHRAVSSLAQDRAIRCIYLHQEEAHFDVAQQETSVEAWRSDGFNGADRP